MLLDRSAHGWCLAAVAALLTCPLAGCASAAPGEPLGETESPITYAPDTFPNDPTACDYFVAKGLTAYQAAGIVGNLDQESGVDPTAVQAGGPGRGIAQWSVGGRWDTDSGDNAVAYASQEGQSVYSLELQLDFIWFELTTFSGYGLAALRQSTNVTDATVAFETDFEGCGECDQSTRIAYAEAILPSCAPPLYAAQFVSQSFPLATTAMTMTEGQVVPSYIELKNVGSKAWDSNTRIGTTEPRDRKSVFADKTWIASDRPAAVVGTVPPGGTYKFTFDLAAPNTAGTYDEFFGVVEDGVAWFSDPGEGGPADDDLEVKVTVVAAPVHAGAPDAGAPQKETDAGAGGSTATGGEDGGAVGGGEVGADDGGALGTDDDGSVGVGSVTPALDAGGSGTGGAGFGGGCSVGHPHGEVPPCGHGVGVLLMMGVLARLASRRRRMSAG